MYYNGDAGGLCSVVEAWTSLSPPDPFVVVAAGRCAFRFEDLQGLRRLLDALSGTVHRGRRDEEAQDV